MGTCWKMMVDRGWSVSISSILVSATFLTWVNVEITEAQKISNAMLDDILGDIASQYQSADYGGMDYNDLLPEETPAMYKDAAEPRSLKQNHQSKGPIKNSMCDTEHMFSCPDATLSNIYKKQQDADLSYL